LAEAEEELCIVQARRGELEAVREQLAGVERQVAQATQRRQGIEARLASAQKELEGAHTADEIVKRHQDGFERYSTAQAAEAELDERQRQRQQVEAKRSAADKTLALHTTRLAQVEQELAESAAAAAKLAALEPALAEQARLEQALAAAQQQQARLEDAQRNASEQRTALTRLQARLAALQSQYSRTATLEGEKRTADQRIDQIQQRIDECREELGRQKSRADLIKEQSKQLEDIRTALCPVCEQPLTDEHRHALVARNGDQLVTMRQSYANVQRQMREHQTALAAQQDAVERIQAELRQLPRLEEINGVQQEVSRLQVAVDAAEAQVAQLSAAPDQVQTLSRQLAALGDPRRDHAVAAEAAGRRPALEAQLAQARNQVAAAQQTLAEVERALAAFAGLDDELETVAAELKRYHEAYQAVLSHRRVAEGLPARRVEVDGLNQDLAVQSAEVAHLEVERAEVAARFDAAAYRQLSERSQELQSQIGGLKTRIALLADQQRQDQQEIDSLKAVAATVAVAQSRQTRLAEQEDVLESIRSMLRQAGPYITTALIRQISDGARQIFSEIMQDYSRHLSWNEDYGITLEVDGHQRQFAQLSGGEQMSAALAVRLALLREMSNIDVAFFDEPTANLDEQRREALARQILSVRGFRQIFVISHDDTFEQATQTLVRVQRVDGVSRVSVE
jgi:exonuclease SbcC